MAVEARLLPANRTTLNVAAATVVATPSATAAGTSPQPVVLVRISVNTVGGTAGTINDCATTGAVAATNLVYTIPTTAVAGTVIELQWPMFAGLCVTSGTSGVLAVTWSA